MSATASETPSMCGFDAGPSKASGMPCCDANCERSRAHMRTRRGDDRVRNLRGAAPFLDRIQRLLKTGGSLGWESARPPIFVRGRSMAGFRSLRAAGTVSYTQRVKVAAKRVCGKLCPDTARATTRSICSCAFAVAVRRQRISEGLASTPLARLHADGADRSLHSCAELTGIGLS